MKINFRFIKFVFLRYIFMIAGYTPLSILIIFFAIYPYSFSLRFSFSTSLGIMMAIWIMTVMLPLTYRMFPYYDCDNNQHLLYVSWNYEEAWWHCSKCSYKREFTNEEYRTIRLPMPLRRQG